MFICKLFQYASVSLLLLTLVSCGGGSSGNDHTAPITSVTPNEPTQIVEITTGVVQLGPVQDARVQITSLDGLSTYFTTTTNPNGLFEIDRIALKQAIEEINPTPEFLKLVTQGGTDIDPDDDGVQNTDEYKTVAGSVVGIISVDDLLNKEKVSINLITTAAAELLKDKQTITASDISHVLSKLTVSDINEDGKVDNNDIIEYDMVQHDSGAEAKLRYQYLDLIHEGDTENQQNYIETLQEEESYVVRQESQQGNSLLVTLKALSENNYIKYGINTSTDKDLPSLYQGETITLQNQDYLYYEECKSDDTCYHREFTYFDGVETTAYYPIPYIGNVYTDPDKIAELRLDYLEKRHYFLNPDEYKSLFDKDIEDKKKEISDYETRLAEIEDEIASLTDDGSL